MPATTKSSNARIQSLQHAEIWELLNEYADIRDELEDTFDSFHYLKADIETAMDDIADELNQLQEHLNTCSARLMRLRPSHSRQYEVIKEQELPFSETE